VASDLPTTPTLPPSWQARVDQLQAQVREGRFDLNSVPGYVPGRPPSTSTWHHIDHRELVPHLYGREMGANGIGRLTEVALVEITENERFVAYDQDPAYFPKMGLAHDDLDIGRMRDQSAQYEAALEEAGVVVHRIAYPDPPVGAFGPLRGTWAANEVLVLRGGSVIEKNAISPMGIGKAEYLAYWLYTVAGVPPVLTINGTGVAEAGPCFWLAEDVFVNGRGLGYNDEGVAQLQAAVQASTDLPMHFVDIRFPGRIYFDPESGQSHHPDMVLGPLDAGKVIAYPAGLDFETLQWLEHHGFEIIEVERDEQAQFAPANVTILEPGRVIMHAEAPKAIAAVRKAGVDVVEVPYSEFLRTGGGLHCSTMRIHREPGPALRAGG
jgi:N-dimethylarginine dimethylaminohydrolase